MGFKTEGVGVPGVAQWVKNPTAVILIIVEMWVQSQACCSGLKDLTLLQMWCRSQLWLGFSPWPGELSYASGVAVKKIIK